MTWQYQNLPGRTDERRSWRNSILDAKLTGLITASCRKMAVCDTNFSDTAHKQKQIGMW